jgi:predicted O-methyltransferase YrrM
MFVCCGGSKISQAWQAKEAKMFWRFRHLVHRFRAARQESSGKLHAADIESFKRADAQVQHERFADTILKESATPECRAWADRIHRDKLATTRQLGNTKADPRPLLSTRYDTEAEALIGCATPGIGGLLLFAVVRAIKPTTVVEIGTAHGYGALYIGSALKENGSGKLFTFEGMAVRIQISKEAIARFGLESRVEVVEGEFERTIPEMLAKIRPVDLMFSDGGKEPTETWSEFLATLDAMPQGGYMVFDDIAFSPEISSVWRDIARHTRVELLLTVRGRWGVLRVKPEGVRRLG